MTVALCLQTMMSWPDKLSTIINHGMKVRYYHDMIGVNSRLDTMQAAILRVKLKHLDDYIKPQTGPPAFTTMPLTGSKGDHSHAGIGFSTHVFHQYTIRLRSINRDKLREYLESKGIPAMVYYPVPLHRQKAFQYLGLQDKDFPVTEELCRTVLSLPMHTELDEEQLDYITSQVKSFINSH